jgi:two-component system chemotaxis response regulator CheB
MRKIRVLVVDDAVVVRRIVTDVLSADPDIEVVGTAANGRLALAKLPQLAPDLITLDIEMPELDGLETLVEIRKNYPRLPVIMFSTLTERGAVATLEALACGATDYLTKPANAGSVTVAQERIRTELIPKIRALAGRSVRPPSSVLGGAPASRIVGGTPSLPPQRTLPVRAELLVIGVSTGGPNALAEVLQALPAEFPVPIAIVQHMPPVFTRFLAVRLSSLSKIVVREGEEGGLLEPGVAWLAPGNYHMLLRRQGNQVRLSLNQDAPENSCRPAVDPLFRSAAALYGSHALGLVLTGMGHDGLRGAEEIRRAGGRVLVQDEGSSVVWGMPGAIAAAGLADAVLPLTALGAELVQRTAEGRLPRMPGAPSSSLNIR